MAEIKSTMDLVMERMAKMTANAKPVTNDEDDVRAGMRLAADFLNKEVADLLEELSRQKPESQRAMYKGATQTLLRNVVLPRDEALKERSDVALDGVTSIGQTMGVQAIPQICAELQQILQQYNQHKEQVVQQLEEALVGQLRQQYGSRGVDPGQLRASMHPKYHDEMAKMQQDLNGQYNQAMDQRKDMILEHLGLS
jgi:anion-transporting  ArsA/GET3 family ATPase